MKSLPLSKEQLVACVEQTHPGLGGKFSDNLLLAGAKSGDSPEQLKAKARKNLLQELTAAAKIIWVQAEGTKVHYGYGGGLRYVLKPNAVAQKYSVRKQFVGRENSHEWSYQIDFWNLIKNRKTPLRLKDLLATYDYSLAGAKALCARDYEAVTNPKTLAWVQEDEYLHAEGAGEYQYVIQETNYEDLSPEEQRDGKFFGVEIDDFQIQDIVPLSYQACALQEAMEMAQKHHVKALIPVNERD